jgi:uncharacterized protein YodC (DUF2158 family)
MQPLQRWQVISDGDEGPSQQGANLASRAATGGRAMAFKVGDAVRLKSGGAQMIVSKLFKSPEVVKWFSALGSIKNQESTRLHS